MPYCAEMLARLALLSILIASPSGAQNQTLEIVPLGSGVFAAVYSEFRMDPIEGNSLIVVTDDGVLVVDSGRTPASARAMIAEIRKLTPKPVRFVVNTHWHDDHVFGNQEYAEAFPDVQFIAHHQTRTDMREKSVPSLKDYGVEYWTKMAADVEARLASGVSSSGTPLTDAQKQRLGEQSKTLRAFLPKIESLRVVFPNVTFGGRFTIHAGDREIQLLHLGLGNTQGDVAVYLPKDGILAMGDLLVHPVPFAYGSSMREWIATLKRYRDLNPSVILPGHGPVMRDADYLTLVIDLFESLVAQVDDAVKRGLTLDETRKIVDLTAFRTRMAGDDPVRNGVFGDSILRSAVELAYKAATAAR